MEIKLPVTNQYGYYEIRLERIGGLGANICGKLLGELGAMELGLESASFSSYGSEKRGSPVKAYIRWSNGDDIRVNSPVENPHLLGVFHENMIGRMQVSAGCGKDSKIVINTEHTPEEMRDTLQLAAGEIFCIDALKLAMETKSRINMVMLGALVRAMGFAPLEAAEKIVEGTLGKKYPALLEANLNGLRSGYEQVVSAQFPEDGKYKYLPYQESRGDWGYKNAPAGGVNPLFGSSISNDLSASREGYVPLFLPEKCIHCGLCDSTCPDMVFQFIPGEYKGKPAMMNRGLDYHHCKGCLRCVNVCPTEALVVGKEREHPEKKYEQQNRDLIETIDYDASGPNSWVTSDAYLDEKRVDGGIV